MYVKYWKSDQDIDSCVVVTTDDHLHVSDQMLATQDVPRTFVFNRERREGMACLKIQKDFNRTVWISIKIQWEGGKFESFVSLIARHQKWYKTKLRIKAKPLITKMLPFSGFSFQSDSHVSHSIE